MKKTIILVLFILFTFGCSTLGTNPTPTPPGVDTSASVLNKVSQTVGGLSYLFVPSARPALSTICTMVDGPIDILLLKQRIGTLWVEVNKIPDISAYAAVLLLNESWGIIESKLNTTQAAEYGKLIVSGICSGVKQVGG